MRYIPHIKYLKYTFKNLAAIVISSKKNNESIELNKFLLMSNLLDEMTINYINDIDELSIKSEDEFINQILEIYEQNSSFKPKAIDISESHAQTIKSILNKNFNEGNLDLLQALLTSLKYINTQELISEQKLLGMINNLSNHDFINFISWLSDSISSYDKKKKKNINKYEENYIKIILSLLSKSLSQRSEVLSKTLQKLDCEKEAFSIFNICTLNVLRRYNEQVFNQYIMFFINHSINDVFINQLIYQYIYFVKAETRSDDTARIVKESNIPKLILEKYFTPEDYKFLKLADLLYLQISNDKVLEYLAINQKSLSSETILEEFTDLNCNSQTIKITPGGLLNFCDLLDNTEAIRLFTDLNLEYFTNVISENCDIESTIELLNKFFENTKLDKITLKSFLLSLFNNSNQITSLYIFKLYIIKCWNNIGIDTSIYKSFNNLAIKNKKRLFLNLIYYNQECNYQDLINDIFTPLFNNMSNIKKISFIEKIFEQNEYFDNIFEITKFLDEAKNTKDYRVIEFLINEYIRTSNNQEMNHNFLLKIIKLVALNEFNDNGFVPVLISCCFENSATNLIEEYSKIVIKSFNKAKKANTINEFNQKFCLNEFLHNCKTFLNESQKETLLNCKYKGQSIKEIIKKHN